MKTTSLIRLFRATGAVVCTGIAMMLATPARAVVVDGFFDPNEGYTNSTQLYFGDQQSGVIVNEPGTIYWQVNQTTGNVYACFVMPLSINDNTYGVNSIGWFPNNSKPKYHTFGNLTGSDHGQFLFTNSLGNTAIQFKLDYLTATNSSPSGYDSLGVLGGDGDMIVGSSANILQWGTSLDYNFNVLGYKLTTDSPAAHPQLNPDGTINYMLPYILDDPNYTGWVFNIIYEVEVSAAAFGQAGFGGVTFPEAHNSPSKKGQNTIPLIPETSALPVVIGLAGLVVLGEMGRRRSRRELTA